MMPSFPTRPAGLVALTLVLLVVAGAVLPAAADAQTPLGSQTLGRGYWHVFAAYVVAWLLVMGWTVSIGRRLADVERRIGE